MKCKVCGHRANTISAMSAHYRKKHPQKMRRRMKQGEKLSEYHARRGLVHGQVMGYCPLCGNKIA